MVDPSLPNVPSGVFWGGLTLWLGRELWAAIITRRKDKAETTANITLVQGLADRVAILEKSQVAMEERLGQEVQARMAAQELAHKLKLRVNTLESILKGLGAVIPEEH